MILDSQMTLSDAQSLTASGNSTNVLDFATLNRRIGSGEHLQVRINVDTALAGTAPNVRFQWRQDNNATPLLPVAVSQTFTSLAQGAQIELPIPAGVAGRYGALYFEVVSGTVSAFAFTAEVVETSMRQDWAAHASGFSIA